MQRGRQRQGGWLAVVEHQAVAHGGRGAVQIDCHQAGLIALGTMAGQQLAGPPQLILLGVGIAEQFGSEAAVQVPLLITTIGFGGGRIANHQFKGQAMALQLARV